MGEKLTLKQQFLEACKEVKVPKVITVAVKLPYGAIEIITNTEHTIEKVVYYTDKYDDDFRLKANPQIQIVGCMVV